MQPKDRIAVRYAIMNLHSAIACLDKAKYPTDVAASVSVIRFMMDELLKIYDAIEGDEEKLNQEQGET